MFFGTFGKLILVGSPTIDIRDFVASLFLDYWNGLFKRAAPCCLEKGIAFVEIFNQWKAQDSGIDGKSTDQESSPEKLSVISVSKAPDAGGHKTESSSPGSTDGGGGILESSTSAATLNAEMILGEVSLVEYCREGMVEEQDGGSPMLPGQAYEEGETPRGTLLEPDIAPAEPETLEKRFVEPAS